MSHIKHEVVDNNQDAHQLIGGCSRVLWRVLCKLCAFLMISFHQHRKFLNLIVCRMKVLRGNSLKTPLNSRTFVFKKRMKKAVIIFFTLLYTVSTVGVMGSNFYCCGKYKETNLFSTTELGAGCTNDKKEDGCCNIKTFFIKVTDQHAPSSRITVNGHELIQLIPALQTALFIFQNEVASSTSSHIVHSPPLLYKQPVYLDNCTFRI
jgi:hypothetical protein